MSLVIHTINYASLFLKILIVSLPPKNTITKLWLCNYIQTLFSPHYNCKTDELAIIQNHHY